MELLLARGGGKGLFEGLFLFGTASFEEEMDGDDPVKVDLDVDFEFFVCPLSGFLGTELKKANENPYILGYFFFMLYKDISLNKLMKCQYLGPRTSVAFLNWSLSISSLPSKFPPPDLMRFMILDSGPLLSLYPLSIFELSSNEFEFVDIFGCR